MAYQKQKGLLRAALIKSRMKQNKKILKKKSFQIIQKLNNSIHFKKANTVLFYFPIKSEVDTLPLIQRSLNKKQILLPKIEKSRMTARKISNLDKDIEISDNIPTPKAHCPIVPKKKIEVMIVPGVGFTREGHRLGFGKGHFDRYLKNTPGFKIGLGYDFQILKTLPVENHDQKMDLIISN